MGRRVALFQGGFVLAACLILSATAWPGRTLAAEAVSLKMSGSPLLETGSTGAVTVDALLPDTVSGYEMDFTYPSGSVRFAGASSPAGYDLSLSEEAGALSLSVSGQQLAQGRHELVVLVFEATAAPGGRIELSRSGFTAADGTLLSAGGQSYLYVAVTGEPVAASEPAGTTPSTTDDATADTDGVPPELSEVPEPAGQRPETDRSTPCGVESVDSPTRRPGLIAAGIAALLLLVTAAMLVWQVRRRG